MISLYNIIWIVSELFGTYIIYRFMHLFFDLDRHAGKKETICYVVYFCINVVVYYFYQMPIFILIWNLLLFFLLSLQYPARLEKRILIVILIYLILMSEELIGTFIIGKTQFEICKTGVYHSILGLCLVRMISYVTVLILQHFQNRKKETWVPRTYWCSVIIILIFSMYLFLMIFFMRKNTVHSIAMEGIFILLVNFILFYLYEDISKMIAERTYQMRILEQNQSYKRQLEIMESSLKAIQTMRHDMKNHLLTIQFFAKKNQIEELLEHLSGCLSVLEKQSQFVHTGNVVVDSMLNFKLQEAKQNGIRIAYDICISEDIPLSSFDLTTMLGNLLDNAYQACMLLEESARFLSIWMKQTKGRVFLKIENSFNGIVLKSGEKFLTTKMDQKMHGIGLSSIEEVVKKYQGTIEVSHEKNIFSVSILLYLA